MILSRLLASLVFVNVILVARGAPENEEPKKKLESASTNLTTVTNAVIDTGTNSVESVVHDGRLLFEMGKLQQAEEKLRTALQIDPSNKQAVYYLRLIEERKRYASTNRWNTGFNQMIYPTLPLRRVGDRRHTAKVADSLSRTARAAEAPQGETSPARVNIFRKLHAIRLPRVAWENVPLLKALEELSVAVKQNDPEQQGILFTSRSTNSGITIRLSLRNVSAAEAVDAITKVSDVPLTYSIEDPGVAINDRGPVPKLFSRTFNVDPHKLMTTLKELGYPKLELSAETFSHDFRGVRRTNYSAVANLMVREYLLATGVDLNPPKYLFFNDRRGQLLIRATEQDLERVSQLIKALHVEAPRFLIEVKAVELDDATATKLGLDRLLTGNKELARMIGSDMVTGVLSDDEYRTTLHVLERGKNVEVFAAEKATIRCGVQEQLIGFGPTNRMDGVTLLEHLSPHLSSYVTNIEEPVIRLDVLPLASSNEFSLNLNIIPRIIEILSNEQTNGADGKPVAHARTRDRVETITMWDGQTVVLGRVAKRNKNLTLFLTATLVDSAGNRLHTKEQMRSAHPTKAPDEAQKPAKVYYIVPGKEEILRRLQTIRLHNVSFDDLSLPAALKQLSDATKENDPENKGIMFASFSTNSNLTVKLTLRNVRATDVVDAILKVTESQLKYSVEETGVVFTDLPPEPPPQLFNKTFHVDLNAMTNAFASVTGLTSNVPVGMLHEWLKNTGVDLAPPRFLFLNETRGMILVRATEEELKTVGEVIDAINSPPSEPAK